MNTNSILRPGSLNRLARRFVMMLLIAAPIANTQAAIDVFLRLVASPAADSPKGESIDETYKGSDGWFEIRSFSFGIENSVTIGGATGGAGAGKASFVKLDVAKIVDSASPALFKALASGRHFETAQLVVRKSGAGTGTSQAYLTYEFKTVFLTSQVWAASSGDDAPAESLRMDYAAMKISYRPTDPTGKPGTPIEAMWDVTRNTATF